MDSWTRGLVDSWYKSGVQCWKLWQSEDLHDLSKEKQLGEWNCCSSVSVKLYPSEDRLTNGRAQFLADVSDLVGARILRWFNKYVEKESVIVTQPGLSRRAN